MNRDLEETLASQDKMLSRLGREGSRADHATIKRLFENQVQDVERWMSVQPNINVLHVDYRDVVEHPASCAGQIGRFMGRDLDMDAMAAIVDPALHRNRAD